MLVKFWKRRVSSILAFCMFFSLFFGTVSPTLAADDSGMSVVVVKKTPTDDATIHSGSTTTNYGTATSLVIGSSRSGLMKFDLSDITDPIQSATLKIYKDNTNATNFTVYRSVYDNWSESTITWDKWYPKVSGVPDLTQAGESLISTACATTPCAASGAAGTLVSINLTDTVVQEMLGDKKLSLVFKRTDANGVDSIALTSADIASKENIKSSNGYRPVLEISTLKAMTTADRIANDKAKLLEQFNNKSVSANLSLPTEGATNTAITWTSSQPTALSNSGVVTRPEYTQSDIPVTLTATLTYGGLTDTATMNVTVLRMPTPTDAERVAKDKELLIAKYNNMTVYGNVLLQPIGTYGFSTMSWKSDQSVIVSDTGVVQRPLADQTDVKVKMEVNIHFGTVTEVTYVNFLVPKLTIRTATKLQALENMILEAGKLKEQFNVGTAPGQVVQAAKDEFATVIAYAQTVVNNPDGDLELGMDRLRTAGKTFISTAVISNTVIDVKENKLAYSTYRQELTKLVWEAKGMLQIDPDMYTQASKDTVQEQIDHAEAVLNGTYKVPFVRNREFNKPRPDEDIQFAIDHYSKASLPFAEKYGLKELISWYASNHILAGTYYTIQLSPTDDAFVWVTEKTKPHNGNTLIYSEGRTAYMKFDLSSITANVMKADLHVSNFKTDRNNTQVHVESNDSWQEDTLVYPTSGDPVLGPIVNTFILGTKDAIGAGTVDLTSSVKVELLGDKKLSLSFDNTPGTTYASEIYSNNTSDPAKRPYLELSLNQIVDAKLQQKYDRIIADANSLVQQGVIGSGAWQYPQSVVNGVNSAVTAAIQANQNGNTEAIGAALVRVYNAMNIMRDAQILRTEAEPNSNLYFTEAGLQELRDKITQDPQLKAKYEEAKQISDQQTLAELESYKLFLNDQVDYTDMNSKFKLWSTSSTLNFNPPAGTATATLQFTLDSADNEAAGLGHAWIDSVKISPPDAADLDILNPGFDTGTNVPDYWQPSAVKGSPIMRWEDRTNYRNDGSRSIYIENPTVNDQGIWTSQQNIPVTPGLNHTLTFAAKIDGKLNKGVKAIITYKNQSGATIGSVELVNNKKSTMGPNSNLSIQADALVYAVTGDITYAKKVKERIFYNLNDFLQGAEYWQLTNARPDGIDAYGKVQGGRVASVVASAYTFIKNAGVYTEEEHRDLIDKLTYFNLFLNDRRDRGELDDYTVQLGSGNWESDAVTGASMLAMVFPELPASKLLIANANKLLKAQLNYQVGAEGEWPESVRYHFAVLQRLAVYAKSLRNQTGEDWFANPKLVKMFAYNLEVQTPPYEYTDNKINSPIFGDDIMTSGNEFSLLGVYYDEVGRTNEALASKMYQTWVKAGSRLPANGLETILLESFFTPLHYTPSYTPLDLKSTDKYQGVGLVMFRSRYGNPNETFMSIMANTKALGHGHFDQGSFVLYAGGSPLVLDSGVESYFAGTKAWYTGSSSHSTVQFKKTDNTSYLNTPATSDNHSFSTNTHIDTTSLRVADPNANSTGSQTRKIAYVKDGMEAFVIWDQIKGSSSSTIWNLPVAASQLSDIQGNKVTSTGHYNMDLETTVLQPANPNINQEWGRSTNMVPKVDGDNKLNYIRITNQSNQNYLTVLYPKGKGTQGLVTEQVPVSSVQVDVYRLQTVDNHWAYVALNNGATDASVSVPADSDLMDLKTEMLYPVTDGNALIQVGAGEMVVLKSTTTEEPPIPNTGGNTVPPTEQPSSQVDHNKVTVEVKLDDKGTASAVITDRDLAKAIQNSTDSTVIISAKATGAAKAVKVDIPVQEFLAAGKNQVDVLKVDTGFAKVSLSSKLLAKEGATHIQLQVAQVDTSSLSVETRQQVGSTAAIYDFSLMVNGKQVTDFNGNEVKVELPYTLAPGENPKKIVVYYLTDDGKLEVIKNGKYDPATGMVAFNAKHFSRYLAAYTELSFHDLAGVKWASDAIEALAARGIVQGVGNSRF
ncbi:immunoglobulin-like domain-containing protein [Paenibacillus sp. Soil750]|uniref:immunoglobulin-like domain-containing protein n=1 Tax=Paenibacillus sp. Soil750 TaxID=1736398 RepID=UPI0006FB4E34|nr:immunoglobulin-like domain-containing protein [Paenibacillus sp. Soil750]KRE69606.1 hypothetical protein ASL11_14580 [Paenibacillus sp. Soil750]